MNRNETRACAATPGRLRRTAVNVLLALAVCVPAAAARAEGAKPASTPAATPSVQSEGPEQAKPAPKLYKPVPPHKNRIAAKGCDSPGALGVSRIQEIETASGPRLGSQHTKDTDFLGDHEIVLTFDDGPLRPYTMPVLKALEAHCTHATFFMVGRMALSDPAMVRETEKRGHTIGTHTWSHVDVRKTGPSRGKGEVELGLSAVSRALGHPAAPFFRFPYLSAPQNVADYARSRKLAVFAIDVDSNDYRSKDPVQVHAAVLHQLEETGKGIILFHDIQPSTAHALSGLLDELKARGFKVVHVVPKGTATTLPEYDEIAQSEMNRKSTAAADDPLATRSFVWPASAGRDLTPAKRPPGGRVAAGLTQPEQEVLPWGIVAVRPEPIVPTRRQPRPPADDGDWVSKLFKW